MKTYPGMNEKIVGILRISVERHTSMLALRIEELEAEVKELEKKLLFCLENNRPVPVNQERD